MKDRETVAFTTDISQKHLQILEELSKRTGKSIDELLKEALVNFLEEVARKTAKMSNLSRVD
ncbi:hypothetical protein J7K92_00955 [bacterium]|nr:hypothetical protein [bacterium]